MKCLESEISEGQESSGSRGLMSARVEVLELGLSRGLQGLDHVRL